MINNYPNFLPSRIPNPPNSPIIASELAEKTNSRLEKSRIRALSVLAYLYCRLIDIS